jgi:RNA polymerase sigma factor (sigma-70 family)
MLTRLIPPAKLDDARLVARTGDGDPAAFAALYDRHHASLLAFCRHMLGNRQDGEDALQQTFIRAHRAMLKGSRPEAPRAWLFAIARNRCRTMLAARADTLADGEEQLERVCVDGLTAEVQQRAELRELLADMTTLPEEQRAALLLTELRGFSHDQIALVIGCPAQKVKALVFQARTHLLAERDARDTECTAIREQLEVARGGELRRGLLRRHLRRCEPCKTYSMAVATQRNQLAGVLGVLPSAGLKLSVLGAVGLTGGKGAAGGAAGGGGGAGAAGLAGGGAGGAASGTAVSGVSMSAAAEGVATKLAVVKVAAVLAVSGAAAGGATAVVNHDRQDAKRGSVQTGQGARPHTTSTPGKRVAGRHRGTRRSGPATRHARLKRQRSATRRARAGKRAGARRGTRTGKLLPRRRAKDRRAATPQAAKVNRRKNSGTGGGRTGAGNAGRRNNSGTGGRTTGGAAGGRTNSGGRAGAGAAGRRTGERRHGRGNPRPRGPRRSPPVTPAPAPQPAPPPPAGSPAEPNGTVP